MSYTKTNPPTFATLVVDLGPVWSVIWHWPEKTGVGFRNGLIERCGHKHRDYARAIECAKTRVEEVRES